MRPKGLAAGPSALISGYPVHRRWTGVTNKCSISRLLAQDGRPRFDTGLKSPHTGAMLRPILASAALLGCLAPSTAPGQAEKAAPEVPSVRDLGNGKFEVGLVTFHQQSREISFPSEVNMKEGALEYAVVHHNGKIHEAILITKARPFHVNIALKILGYKESKELFPILDEDFRPTGKFPKVPEAVRNAARAGIHLEWKDKRGKVQTATLNDWITHTVTNKALPAKPWVYGGSYIHNNSFQAEASGDIVALFTNNASLFNWPGRDGNLDDVWIPTSARVPEVGTSVKVIIKPFLKTEPGPTGKASR